MANTIRIRPSGRAFVAGPHDTILEAGLRAGLALRHRCSNGSCGECKARVVAGELATVGFHDYPLSEAEKAQGYTLMCRARAATDLTIEAREAGGVADIPDQSLVARVSNLERPTPDVLVVHLRPSRGHTLEYLAGQYVTLEIKGVPARDKALASCPCAGLQLQIHCRRAAGDPFSEYLFERLEVSERIAVWGPLGRFTFDELSHRPVVFIAYETGFAQIKSLIEHAISLETNVPMHLYWLAEREDGHYLDNYCRSWADAFENFRYTPLTLAVDRRSLPERVLEAIGGVSEEHPDLGDHDVYLTAPEEVRAELRARLLAVGLPASRLWIDTVDDDAQSLYLR